MIFCNFLLLWLVLVLFCWFNFIILISYLRFFFYCIYIFWCCIVVIDSFDLFICVFDWLIELLVIYSVLIIFVLVEEFVLWFDLGFIFVNWDWIWEGDCSSEVVELVWEEFCFMNWVSCDVRFRVFGINFVFILLYFLVLYYSYR